MKVCEPLVYKQKLGGSLEARERERERQQCAEFKGSWNSVSTL
jgi:hypothetical protein